MEESTGPTTDARDEAEQPSVSPTAEVGPGDAQPAGDDQTASDRLAPNEAFQTLASEHRVAVLVELLAVERDGEGPCSFSELQHAVGADSSAGFAYHLRQLSDHFVTRRGDGYVLTALGRRAAEAIVDGTFTELGDRFQAS